MVPKCPVCGLSGLRRKRDAAFTASWEYVTVQVLKQIKCAVVCYLQGRTVNPANLLNHVALSIELMMQIEQSVVIITALCNNLKHLRLTR